MKKCQQTELNIVAYLSMNSLQYSYFSGGENLSCKGQSVQQILHSPVVIADV